MYNKQHGENAGRNHVHLRRYLWRLERLPSLRDRLQAKVMTLFARHRK